MKIDSTGRAFIYKHEGVVLHAYHDQVGIPTIGVGFTYYPGGKKVEMGDTITQAECDGMFTNIVSAFEEGVTKAVTVPLTQNQFNALVSFSFNVGIAGFDHSTLLKRINAKSSIDLIKAAFLMWDMASGKVIEDLKQRRLDEFNLFEQSLNDETISNLK